eukprot:12881_1
MELRFCNINNINKHIQNIVQSYISEHERNCNINVAPLITVTCLWYYYHPNDFHFFDDNKCGDQLQITSNGTALTRTSSGGNKWQCCFIDKWIDMNDIDTEQISFTVVDKVYRGQILIGITSNDLNPNNLYNGTMEEPSYYYTDNGYHFQELAYGTNGSGLKKYLGYTNNDIVTIIVSKECIKYVINGTLHCESDVRTKKKSTEINFRGYTFIQDVKRYKVFVCMGKYATNVKILILKNNVMIP